MRRLINNDNMTANKAKDALLQMPLRADKWDEELLLETFVNIGSLIPLLKGANNHILYGRRGTGKTHVFYFLKNTIEKEYGDICIYIDLRTIGSTGSIYSDTKIPSGQRASRLISDILKEMRNQLISYIVKDDSNKDKYLSEVTPILDDLFSLLDNKKIDGRVKQELGNENEKRNDSSSSFTFAQTPALALTSTSSDKEKNHYDISTEGIYIDYLDLNSISQTLQMILGKLSPHKIWLFLDEYAELNSDMQIALADIIRHIFCPLKDFIFKIAAIEHRSTFKKQIDAKNYLGLELGADCSVCNLDDFMVFGNNQAQSTFFFRDLIFRHTNAMLQEGEKYQDSTSLIKDIFTQEPAFDELVFAAEGVPRDAFNILAKAITEDYNSKISVNNIRKAAKKWYTEDKLNSVISYPQAQNLLTWILTNVINKRRARAFLLRNDIEYELIDYLYDSRILHIIKQDISSRDNPGMKFSVYSIDYGCYVDLLNTTQKPLGLYEVELDDGQSEYCQVPRDDYRSIRRAILNMDDFEKFRDLSSSHRELTIQSDS